jgi:hypothetical protein
MRSLRIMDQIPFLFEGIVRTVTLNPLIWFILIEGSENEFPAIE